MQGQSKLLALLAHTDDHATRDHKPAHSHGAATFARDTRPASTAGPSRTHCRLHCAGPHPVRCHAEQPAQRGANLTIPSSAQLLPCTTDQWWSERLRRTFSATLVVAGRLVRLTGSAPRYPAMCTLLAREKQFRSKTTGATRSHLHNASGGVGDGRTYSSTPVVAGQLAPLTGSASQHPAAGKLLAHEPQL